MIGILNFFQKLLDRTRALDFLAPLALRLYLVPVFWMAGSKKLNNARLDCLSAVSGPCDLAPRQDIIDCFSNSEWGLCGTE